MDMNTIKVIIFLVVFIVLVTFFFIWLWKKLRSIPTKEEKIERKWQYYVGLFLWVGGLTNIIMDGFDFISSEFIASVLMIALGYYMWNDAGKKSEKKKKK